jgi:hypothetical protein
VQSERDRLAALAGCWDIVKADRVVAVVDDEACATSGGQSRSDGAKEGSRSDDGLHLDFEGKLISVEGSGTDLDRFPKPAGVLRSRAKRLKIEESRSAEICEMKEAI